MALWTDPRGLEACALKKTAVVQAVVGQEWPVRGSFLAQALELGEVSLPCPTGFRGPGRQTKVPGGAAAAAAHVFL